MLQDIEDEDAQKLVNKCPVNVFDIEDVGKGTRLNILFVTFLFLMFLFKILKVI